MKLQTSSPRSLFLAAIVMLLVGTAMLAVAGFQAWRISRFVERSEFAQGTVTALEPVSKAGNRDADRNVTYAPVFTFSTKDGKTVSVLSRTSSNPPAFHLGDRVTVLYDPANPEEARIDRLWQLWSLPLIFAALGLFLYLMSAAFALALRSLARQLPAAPSNQ
ncbi:MAG: DUF3592 domain-containing protein [Terracidiphilus sp.]